MKAMTNTHWLDPIPVLIPATFTNLNLDPFLARMLTQRGISSAAAARAFLNADSGVLASPFELPAMEAAVERLMLAIRKKEPLCIWGDFDVDGQTSTALLVQTLEALGAHVGYHIPIRARSSHGVHIPELTEIIDNGASLILTCDTGISSHEAVKYAASRNVDFVITDHHELGAKLPEAVAVVNPKRLPRDHALANLAGVGVAYKLAEALFEVLSETANGTFSFNQRLSPDTLLDLVALGLIADIALLIGETRSLVQKGLKILQNTERLGLKIMAELADQPLAAATEEYIGFVLAPRLNALGRLGDANPAVDLLISQDPARARVLAARLEGLNSQRKLLTKQVYRAAEAQLHAQPSLLAQPAIVLSHPSWPGGVVGIVASRLVDRYHKPVILFSTPPGEPARGSARSIEGLHITDAIATQADLLLNYGGHPMAAGLALPHENLPAFQRGLSKAVESMLGEAALEAPSLQIDAWMALEELSFDLAEAIEQLAPFGAGNPPLTFASRNLSLQKVAPIGRSGEHIRLTVTDPQGHEQSVLWWNGAEENPPQGRFDLAFTLRASTFRGQRTLTLQFIDYRPVEEEAFEVKKNSIEVIDLRSHPDPLKELSNGQEEEQVAIYVEGEDRTRFNGFDRYEGKPSDVLALYTAPPGPSELKALLEAVDPHKVYLIARNLPVESSQDFLSRLAGMAKYAIQKKGGHSRISDLAVATVQREDTIRLGLEWLSASGYVTVTGKGDKVNLSRGSGEASDYLRKELYIAVKGLLDETDSFQQYLATTDEPASLFNL